LNKDSIWDQTRYDSWWKAFEEVNAAFAELANAVMKPGDNAWVHDYHLALLPKYLNDAQVSLCGGGGILDGSVMIYEVRCAEYYATGTIGDQRYAQTPDLQKGANCEA